MKFKLKGEQDSRSHTSAGGFQNKIMASGQNFFFFVVILKRVQQPGVFLSWLSAKISRKRTGEGSLYGRTMSTIQAGVSADWDVCKRPGEDVYRMTVRRVWCRVWRWWPQEEGHLWCPKAAESRRIIEPWITFMLLLEVILLSYMTTRSFIRNNTASYNRFLSILHIKQ